MMVGLPVTAHNKYLPYARDQPWAEGEAAFKHHCLPPAHVPCLINEKTVFAIRRAFRTL